MVRRGIVLGIIMVLAFFIPQSIFAQVDEITIDSLTQNKTISGTDTIVNLKIIMNETSQNNYHTNGDVMTSSATIIGFVGLGSLLGSSLVVKKIGRHVITAVILFSHLGILITIHLFVILFAFNNSLTNDLYVYVIYATIYLIMGILTTGAYLTYKTSSYDYDLHKISARIENLSGADKILRDISFVKKNITLRESAGSGPLDNFLPK